MQLISATSPLIPCWHPFNRSSSAAPQRRGPAAPWMLCTPAQTLHFPNLPWALAVPPLFLQAGGHPALPQPGAHEWIISAL